MKSIRLKHRLIIPIALLGIVALLSNILSVVNIRKVNASAADIVDDFMDSKSRLSQICLSSKDIHKMALSHIVATDYNTMITLVEQIKEEEAVLDGMLAEYESRLLPEERARYETLLADYASFKHALVHLVCASAGQYGLRKSKFDFIGNSSCKFIGRSDTGRSGFCRRCPSTLSSRLCCRPKQNPRRRWGF